MSKVTVITTLCTADANTETVALECMAAIDMYMPDAPKIAAIDYATDAVRNHALGHDWRITEIDGGKPPRMAQLLRAALDAVTTQYVMTIEQDAILLTDNPHVQAIEYMRDSNAVACEIYSTLNGQHPTRPCSGRPTTPVADGVVRCVEGVSLNCTVWRKAALLTIDWAAVPTWAKADSAIFDQMLERGETLLMATDIRCIHRRTNSGRALRGLHRA